MESLHQDSQTTTGNPQEPQLERGYWQNLTLIGQLQDHNVYSLGYLHVQWMWHC